jgi:hypothetical protein
MWFQVPPPRPPSAISIANCRISGIFRGSGLLRLLGIRMWASKKPPQNEHFYRFLFRAVFPIRQAPSPKSLAVRVPTMALGGRRTLLSLTVLQ